MKTLSCDRCKKIVEREDDFFHLAFSKVPLSYEQWDREYEVCKHCYSTVLAVVSTPVLSEADALKVFAAAGLKNSVFAE